VAVCLIKHFLVIANSCDSQTPLQAFVSELESIPDDDANTRESLRGIANFMAMMINRSIDFTKVNCSSALEISS
jgi:hypothetical protein